MLECLFDNSQGIINIRKVNFNSTSKLLSPICFFSKLFIKYFVIQQINYFIILGSLSRIYQNE